MEFADVKNDIAFRKIFGNDNRKETLISFLNAVLSFKGKQKIVEVKIMNPYQLPKLRGGKVSIIDVKATDQIGRHYIVEMQVGELDGFAKRVLFYFSKSYSEQIKRGDFYRQLKPVIFIGILDYSFSINSKYISRHRILDVETHEHLLQDVEFNFVELPKFNKELNELETLTEKWIYFIKNAKNLDVIPENVDDEGLKSAYQEANKHTWTPEELEAYDYAFMREEDERAKLDQAEKKGKTQEKIDIAKTMLSDNEPSEKIAKYTGLTVEQIEALRNERE
ncbi:MAG: Rpn family recombination-promoting nuclease/putative transposase [Bernardetiaceae bacterium]